LAVPHALEIAYARDFKQVYGALFDFAKRYPFDSGNEDYWIHITTGTYVVQICMFLMTEARFFPGRLVQTSPPRAPGTGTAGSDALIDLDLSRYDQIAWRFSREQAEGVAFLKPGIPTRNADHSRDVST
jgi:transcriptional regulatory protein RtcR